MVSPSPLRYPGGKAKLFTYMQSLIENNNLKGTRYVEPFAGGCGLALALLQKDLVSQIVINDNDYAIYAFWHSILNHTDEFCDRIYNIDVCIDEWDIQKDIYLHQNAHTILDIGFSTFFLNRTNRSGIINGGIIGGRQQNSQYTIDCRFNKDALIRKINRIATDRERIQVLNYDVFDFITDFVVNLDVDNTLIYFDPPYVKKGPILYQNFFNLQKHQELYNSIVANVKQSWLVTYDHVDEISILYDGYRQDVIDINYSAGVNKAGRELAIFSHNLKLPVPVEV